MREIKINKEYLQSRNLQLRNGIDDRDEMDKVNVYREGNTIYFYDDLDRVSVYVLKKIMNEMIQERFISEVNILINSFGGSTCGIYDYIKSYPLIVNTYVEGYCCSAATVLHLAGKKRYISPTSLYLIHSFQGPHLENFKESTATDLAEEFKKHNEVMLTSIYRAECKLPKDILESISYKECWLRPQECVKYKIANEIKTYTPFK